MTSDPLRRDLKPPREPTWRERCAPHVERALGWIDSALRVYAAVSVVFMVGALVVFGLLLAVCGVVGTR